MLLLAASPARADAPVCIETICTVDTAADLVTALRTVDDHPDTSYVINLTVSLTLDRTLPAINSASTVTINGGGFTLDGASVQRGFFVYAGTVAINNLTIQNTVAQGGTGGGGGGLGDALFVASGASLSVSNVSLTGNSALGGAGGDGNGVGTNTAGGGGRRATTARRRMRPCR